MSVLRSRRLFGLLGPLALAQPHSWAAAVLVDEFDACLLECTTDYFDRFARNGPPRSFKIDDCGQPEGSRRSKRRLGHTEQTASATALSRGNVINIFC